ncbi:MAG: hypothetical protein RBR54_05100 [Sulfurimonas sp.]|jgi:hypothetical protein|nr:hypothetical protein [Sulfurimonas sp.]
MKKYINLSLSALAILTLVGCGSDGDDTGAAPKSGVTGEVVEIATVEDAQNAVASLSSINSYSSDSVSTVMPASGFVEKQEDSILRNLRAQPRETMDCSSGGTMSYDGVANDTSANIVYSFNQCNNYGTLMNGSYSVRGSNDGENISLTGSFNNFKTSSENLSININMTQAIETNIDYNPMKTTTNGTVDVEMGSENLQIGYENFELYMERISYSYQSYQYKINGKTSIQSSINTCANGVYNIETLTPLQSAYGGYESGKMKVNGVVIEYHSGGTATVTFEDGTSETMNQNQSVVCD